ncbi:hypothetical protein BGZ73_001014 [Actinomortierella ambigua]|nr:hypothetical protein BGZ73_001014 [Actinomortierella ambigua]
MAPHKSIILDCDPGIDDTLAILMAMGADEVDLKAITLSYGNTNVENVTKNLFTILHMLAKEVDPARIATISDPTARDRLERISKKRPVIAVGASRPLVHETDYGEDFHGEDGLGCLHLNDPDLAPNDWMEILGLLDPNREVGMKVEQSTGKPSMLKLYSLSTRTAHDEILHQLAEAPAKTITLIGIGPLTNFALAYNKDPVTFARCRRVICMSGNFDTPGNVTPVAEFNAFTCPHSVDIMLQATMSGNPATSIEFYMLPTDVPLSNKVMKTHVAPLQTPLALFGSNLMGYLFDLLEHRLQLTSMSLHDPVCIGFFIDLEHEADMTAVGWSIEERDVRIETEGQLTRGMIVVDRRPRYSKPLLGHPSKTKVVFKADAQRFVKKMLFDIWGIENFSGPVFEQGGRHA